MKLSCISGKFTDVERELNKEYEGEKFYLYDFEIEAGLHIPVQLSEYVTPKIDVPVKLTGHLATTKKFRTEKGKQAMFTFFAAKLIEDYDVNAEPLRTINCEGIVVHIYNMTLTHGGVEKLTIVVKERYDKGRVSIIHYTAMGQLARKLSAQIHVNDNVVGVGSLHQKVESYEVLLSELDIVQ